MSRGKWIPKRVILSCGKGRWCRKVDGEFVHLDNGKTTPFEVWVWSANNIDPDRSRADAWDEVNRWMHSPECTLPTPAKWSTQFNLYSPRLYFKGE